MGDIDFFDITNQIYGSAGGDEVLQSIADLMLYDVEIDDDVIRWEKDRFVLFCSGILCQYFFISGRRIADIFFEKLVKIAAGIKTDLQCNI